MSSTAAPGGNLKNTPASNIWSERAPDRVTDAKEIRVSRLPERVLLRTDRCRAKDPRQKPVLENSFNAGYGARKAKLDVRTKG
jgi:hypothetical protein